MINQEQMLANAFKAKYETSGKDIESFLKSIPGNYDYALEEFNVQTVKVTTGAIIFKVESNGKDFVVNLLT